PAASGVVGAAPRLVAHVSDDGGLLCSCHLPDSWLCWHYTKQHHSQACCLSIDGGLLLHSDVPLFQRSQGGGSTVQCTAVGFAALRPAKPHGSGTGRRKYHSDRA